MRRSARRARAHASGERDRVKLAAPLGGGSTTAQSSPPRIATRLATRFARRACRSTAAAAAPGSSGRKASTAIRSPMPNGPQPRLQVLRVQVAGERLREDVADHAALQQLVAFVQQLGERALGDRDERQLVGHLEQREARAPAGRRHERRREASCGRSPCRSPAPRSRGRPGARRTRAGTGRRRAASPS